MTQPETKKRGRKAGGHNTKQNVITGSAAQQFTDPVKTTEYQCPKCGYSAETKFKFCPECGIEILWP